MALKDWKKVWSGERMRWDNKKSGNSLVVDDKLVRGKYQQLKNGYIVVYFFSGGNNIIKETKTKSQAMGFAKQYMRTH